MDIAVNLVESYLRLTGYLTLSELEVQARGPGGAFETVTDVDVVGLRSPGDLFIGDPHGAEESRLLLIEDPALLLEPDCLDIIIGEVKQGTAEFNPGIKDHRVLHSVLRRFEWLMTDRLEEVVTSIQERGIHISAARGGGHVRARLVAFGQAEENGINTIRLSHVVETLLDFFVGNEEAFRPIQFRQPGVALLRLLQKTGFQVRR